MQDKMRQKLSVFILGTTAVGKTNLSLELCKHLGGEIVSCDSKQLYKHANLMTAKSSPQQLKQFKHNMVDCLQLEENSYNRNKFFQEVKTHANRIWHEGKTPIFIGGTNYYLQPILYNIQDLGRIDSQNTEIQNEDKKQQNLSNEQNRPTLNQLKELDWIKKLTKEEKYQRLKQVDPLMAEKLHKNDQTRVTSFLQRFYRENKRPSQAYKSYTNELNNQNTIVFWVRNSDKMEHRIVVESRIKEMLGKQGILQILTVFTYLDIHYFQELIKQTDKLEEKSDEFKSEHKKRLTVTGIGQSIGYKEFYDFYFHFRNSLFGKYHEDSRFQQVIALYSLKQNKYQKIYSVLQENYDIISDSLLNTKMLQDGQDELIRDTWAYCKRQITWIRNRIFQKDTVLLKRFYILDLAAKQRKYSKNEDENENFQDVKKTFDKEDLKKRFNTKVRSKAIEIIDQIQKNGFQCAYDKFQNHQDEFKEVKQQKKLQNWKKYLCKQCQLQVNGPSQWQEHLNSKRHSKRLKYLDKKADIDKWIESRKKKQAQMIQKKDQDKEKQE